MATITADAKWLHALAAATFIAACWPNMPLNAQGLENEEAVDKIVGSEVEEEQSQAKADAKKVIAAIEKTSDNIPTVRKITKVGKVDIVFLPDAAETEGGPPPEIDAKIKEHEPEITQLREEIQGNAMLFHAIDSRQILVRDVLGLEFNGEESVVIYAAAKPAR
jgi:hypothetical protein